MNLITRTKTLEIQGLTRKSHEIHIDKSKLCERVGSQWLMSKQIYANMDSVKINSKTAIFH